MDLYERILMFLIGLGIGFILGYIVARLRAIESKLEAVDLHVLHVEDEEKDMEHRFRDERGWVAPKWFTFTNSMMIILLGLVAYAAFSAQTASNDVKDNAQAAIVGICKSGADSRFVQRQTVDAVVKLATGSFVRPDPETLSQEEIDQFNSYIDQVNVFQKNMYNNIRPSDQCAPYVEDGDVEPPPPFPHITK